MKIFKPPTKLPHKKAKIEIFLAGSIEMGSAIEWQEKVEKFIDNIDEKDEINIFNPRRDNWDSSWKQSIENAKFKEQVKWELDGLERANLIICYFDSQTKSPITLLELGLHAKTKKLIVFCPEGFWRKGNVDVVAEKYKFPVFNTKKEFFDEMEIIIRKMLNG